MPRWLNLAVAVATVVAVPVALLALIVGMATVPPETAWPTWAKWAAVLVPSSEQARWVFLVAGLALIALVAISRIMLLRRRVAALEAAERAPARPAPAPRWLEHGGVFWQDAGRSYSGARRGPVAEGPFCPEHRVRLMYQSRESGEIVETQDDHFVHRAGGLLFCLDGPHVLTFTAHAISVGEVRHQVEALVERDRAGAAEPAAGRLPLPTFDRFVLPTDVVEVDISGLPKTDSYIDFTLAVANAAGYPVTVTGVDGLIAYRGEELSSPPMLRPASLRLPPTSDRRRFTLRQHVSDNMARRLADGMYDDSTERARFRLSDLRWAGHIEPPQGHVPLRECYLASADVLVRGRKDYDDFGPLTRFPLTFAPQERFDADGFPIPAKQPPP